MPIEEIGKPSLVTNKSSEIHNRMDADKEMCAEPDGLQVLQGWEALKLLQEGQVLMCCLAGGWGKVRMVQKYNSQLQEIQVFQPGFPEKIQWLPLDMDITGFLSFPWRLQT
jgi:hypothetical protein